MNMSSQLIINTTFVVEPSALADFIQWATDMCVPAARAAVGCSDALLLRIIPSNDDEQPSYALQVRTISPEAAHEWLQGPFRMLLGAFYSEHKREHLLYFITMMEVMA